MPLNVTDSSTWEASTLVTPEGSVTYWVLADLDAYQETYVTDGNMTRVPIAVAWQDAELFKKYALGYATSAGGVLTYLVRFTPLPCPFQVNQYLSDLRKRVIHVGVSSTGVPAYAEPDALNDNWFTLPETNGMPPRVVYDATFTCPPYDVIDQTTFVASAYNELKRFVTRERQVNPRERKVPSAGFETAVGAVGSGTPILEVGFAPYVTYDFTYTWHQVPYNLIPDTAIANCLLKVNNATFDYQAGNTDTRMVGDTYGKFQIGDILFKGLASNIRPYRTANGTWAADLPYVFSYQPADGSGGGWNKVPRNDGTWVAVRDRTTGAPLYGSANLDTLFVPGS